MASIEKQSIALSFSTHDFFFPFSPNEYDNKLKDIDCNVNLTDLPNKIFYRLDTIAYTTKKTKKKKIEFITFF